MLSIYFYDELLCLTDFYRATLNNTTKKFSDNFVLNDTSLLPSLDKRIYQGSEFAGILIEKFTKNLQPE